MDGALICATTPSQSRPRNNDNEGILYSSRFPELEPHHQMQLSVIHQDTPF